MLALRGVDSERFATLYWQKQPLLMRQALDPEVFRVTPDELAGFACEPEVESRLVIEHGPTDWQVDHGPFEAEAFSSLPERHWTLLVQDVEKFRSDVNALLDAFDFLPGWRIDDIMISFAADRGGVGPHRDAYDVFLMQGLGRRRWRLGGRSEQADSLIPDLDLRIMARFETEQDWVLEPGDVLYLPAGIAHWGTAIGDCMTYSLGLRATNQKEVAAAWFQAVLDMASDTAIDASPASLKQPGLLDAKTVSEVRRLLTALPDHRSEYFSTWLGGFITEPKPQFDIERREAPWDLERLRHWLANGGVLCRHPWVRFAWATAECNAIRLFANGDYLETSEKLGGLVQLICQKRQITASELGDDDSGAALRLLLALFNAGWLEPKEK
jgi:50S ribosomal protein L16 3-hydroxylase